MRKTIFSVAAIAAAFTAMPATAAVIDFDNLANYTSGVYYEDGYALSANFYNGAGRAINAVASGSSIDPDGVSVVKASGAAVTFTVAREDGAAFEFGSMDFGKLTSVGNTYSSTYQFFFTLADTSVVTKYFTFIHNNPAAITAHAATFEGLGAITKFTFRGQSSAGQFDNIVLNEIAAVPEPASWAMMIGGFAIVGASMRRRSQVSFKLA
jgi:hypothetical protein